MNYEILENEIVARLLPLASINLSIIKLPEVEADKSKSAKLFPWVNRTISNAKKSFLGTYHNAMNDKFMQNYLDEFCYKFNRRYFGENLYERLLLATLKNTWY